MSKPYEVDSEGEEHLSSPPTEAVRRTYGVLNTGTRINLHVHDGGSQGPVLYYINISTSTPGTPDVQVRLGDYKNGQIVALGKFRNLSDHVTMGLDSPDSEGVVYEELKVSRLTHSEYVFGSDHMGRRAKYIWRRAIAKGLFANYACVDAGSGRLMAYFAQTGMKSAKKAGRLCVTAATSEGFNLMLLMSWLAIREKENRNAWFVGTILSTTSQPR